MNTFLEYLNDWTEPEIAMGFLGCILGILEYEGNLKEYVKTTKITIVYTNNDMSRFLFETLESMVIVGFLEKQDDYLYRRKRNSD